MTRRRLVAAVLATVVGALAVPAIGAVPVAAGAAPTPSAPVPTLNEAVPTPSAPRPTSGAASPEAPDPRPPLGGDGPAGVVPGGESLTGRGGVLPSGTARPPAGMTARAWVLVDLGRGTVLAARDPHGRYQPASILKTLTALVLSPKLPASTPIPISQAAADTEGSAVGLVPGGAYNADILFRAMFMMSGNDATEALADAAGGDKAVVAAMNAKIRALGGYDTVAQTPTGLDGWSQLTSAYDLALVLRGIVDDPTLLGYDATRRALLPAQTVLKNGQPVGTIEMDNQSGDYLDTYQGALFAKTGFTDAARHTWLGAARRGDTTLGVVMLRAERLPAADQWQQAAALMDWGFARPHTAAAAVGTLDDADALAAKAAVATTTAAPSVSETPNATATPSATADDGARASAATPRNGGGLPVAPLGYGLAALLLVAAAARFARRRRRR